MKRTYYEKTGILMISIALASFGCGGVKETVRTEPYKYIEEEKEPFKYEVLEEGAPAPQNPNFCTSCGARIKTEEDIKYCEMCGAKIE